MTEEQIAIKEAARNAAVDDYFKARPQLMRTRHEECLVEAGFNAAWQACAARMVPILQLPVFQFDEGMVACGFMEHDSGYGITLHKSAVAGVAGQHVSDENLDKLTTPLAVLLFTSESHARDVYRALIAAPEPKP